MKTRNAIVENFVNKYGKEGLFKIVTLFQDQISNQQIAREFEVTRQRVHQWQKQFTITSVIPVEYVKKRLRR